jgi:hypothetical protein
MRAIGVELLNESHRNLKFVLNDSAIVFFPQNQQHRDIKLEGLSYEDEYRGNALAGLFTPGRIEIRFHRAFSDERVKNLWSEVLKMPEMATVKFENVYYQGRQIL